MDHGGRGPRVGAQFLPVQAEHRQAGQVQVCGQVRGPTAHEIEDLRAGRDQPAVLAFDLRPAGTVQVLHQPRLLVEQMVRAVVVAPETLRIEKVHHPVRGRGLHARAVTAHPVEPVLAAAAAFLLRRMHLQHLGLQAQIPAGERVVEVEHQMVALPAEEPAGAGALLIHPAHPVEQSLGVVPSHPRHERVARTVQTLELGRPHPHHPPFVPGGVKPTRTNGHLGARARAPAKQPGHQAVVKHVPPGTYRVGVVSFQVGHGPAGPGEGEFNCQAAGAINDFHGLFLWCERACPRRWERVPPAPAPRSGYTV